ncbi:MAG: NAD-dependent deacetylase [Acidobacteria bacterium]|nr:MAG: NAD-dependent deacetylase [Acidobacteriota bacterium]RPJ63593.1 MAG: NAD-dependent deacetylase [Acidobacteriota bacterium]
MEDRSAFEQAAEVIRRAEALVVAAGAGMGVDSGLPDFRGLEGFWQAYPPYRKSGIRFQEAANPQHFRDDPTLAWGFYGHRLSLYRVTNPHRGFEIILRWTRLKNLDYFVVTSNVDGHFQKAGFPEGQIDEVHGSIHHLQCLKPCCREIWPNHEEVPVDLETMRAMSLPLCPHCGGMARPNILMFGDWSWLSHRSDRQAQALARFRGQHRSSRLAVLEIGAGTAVATIRSFCEELTSSDRVRIIRVNPRESEIHPPHRSLATGALEALEGIDALL